MSEGNPGALNVLTQIIKNGAEIDPDGAMGGLGAILMLDTYGFYGSPIWCLYKDLCNMNLTKTLGIIRAMQLGFVDSRLVHRAIGDGNMVRGEPGLVDVEKLVAEVKERLPKFGAPATPSTPTAQE